MSAILAATLVTIGDLLTAARLKAIGTDGSGYGLGVSGASSRAWKRADDIIEAIKDTDDNDQIASLINAAIQLRNKLDANQVLGTLMSEFFGALNTEGVRSAGVGSLAGVNSFDTLLSYYNTGSGGPWNALMPPDFRDTYYNGSNPHVYPTAWNVYFEIVQGGTYTNGLRKLVVGTGQTAGDAIDSTKYAGGFGQIKWSGASGSGVVTVTGLWRKTDGTTEEGAGTANLSGGSGTAVLTPPFANALLISVSALSAVVGVSAGTIYAEATKPSGRTNPPT